MSTRTRTRTIKRSLFVAGLFALLAASPARAEEAQIKRSIQNAERRVLGDHAFLPSQLVVWPFVTTHFGTTTGLGYASMSSVGQDENGDAVQGSMALGDFNQTFDLGIAFTDWIGMQLRLGGRLNAGASLTSALSVGAIFSGEVKGGLIGRLVKRGPFQLAMKLGGGYVRGKQLNPLNMLQTDDSGNLALQRSKLLSNVESWQLGPSLMAAYAPLRWLGLQTSFTFEYGKMTLGESTSDNKTLSWAVSATLDGRGVFLPIAIPIAYQLQKTLEEGGALEHRTESGIYYSGRTNLLLGLSAATKVGSKEDGEYLGEFRMYYYW